VDDLINRLNNRVSFLSRPPGPHYALRLIRLSVSSCHPRVYTCITIIDIGVGDGGQGARAPIEFGKKISDNFYVKFGHFSGKNDVKCGHFVNFHTYFSAKNVVPPKVD